MNIYLYLPNSNRGPVQMHNVAQLARPLSLSVYVPRNFNMLDNRLVFSRHGFAFAANDLKCAGSIHIRLP